jgi:oligopeptide/dipeptide ABC transporter ATP-binding protein
VTIQAQVLDLMKDLRRDFAGAIIFITHDLGVVATMADRVAVMYRGKVVESGTVREIYRNPLHPYTQGLLRSVPSITGRGARRLATIEGTVPRPTERISGCSFAPRFPNAMPVCREAVPALAQGIGSAPKVAPTFGSDAPSGSGGHAVACYLHHAVAEERAHAA